MIVLGSSCLHKLLTKKLSSQTSKGGQLFCWEKIYLEVPLSSLTKDLMALFSDWLNFFALEVSAVLSTFAAKVCLT